MPSNTRQNGRRRDDRFFYGFLSAIVTSIEPVLPGIIRFRAGSGDCVRLRATALRICVLPTVTAGTEYPCPITCGKRCRKRVVCFGASIAPAGMTVLSVRPTIGLTRTVLPAALTYVAVMAGTAMFDASAATA